MWTRNILQDESLLKFTGMTNKSGIRRRQSSTALLLAAFVSLALAPAVLLAQAAPAGIAFVSTPQTVAAGAVSGAFTIQLQDAAGNETKTTSTACAVLSSDSATGQFSSSRANWSAVSVLAIAKNSANRNFYYKDAGEGTYTLSVKAAQKPEGENRSCANWPLSEWPAASWSTSQSITVGTAASSSGSAAALAPSAAPAGTPAPHGGGGSAAQTEPQFVVEITAPRNSVAGADVLFEARALGYKNEPLLNARYLWSFGDGGFGEGKKVLHEYHYPAVYVVMVEVASGERSTTARREIAVSAPQVVISRIKEGPDGFIEVGNRGAEELDLSRWFLRSAGKFFSFPKGTALPAQRSIPFAAVITGLSGDPSDTALLFPNGTVAAPYERPKGTPPALTEKVSVPSAAATSFVRTPAPAEPPAPVVARPPEPTAATAPVLAPSALASSVALSAALGPAEQRDGAAKWLLSAAALGIVAASGYLAMLFNKKREPDAAAALRKEADEYDLVE